MNSQPLYLVPDTERFVQPSDKNGNIDLHSGESIEFHCTAGFRHEELTKKSIIAQCFTNSSYLYNGVIYDLNLFRCKRYAYHTARRTVGHCYQNSVMVEDGFNLEDGRFARVLELCHDEVNDRTHYVRSQLSPANKQFQHSTPRPPFIQGRFFQGRNVNKLYTVAMQRKTIANIMNSMSRAAEIIQDPKTEQFLARGHLVPKADFVFGSQQRATFYYVNVSPQWQKFNSGNWERVETSARNLAAKRNINLDVYTGTYGVARVADGNGDLRELYLDFVPNGVSRIPVPAIYYKILHNRSDNSGIAIIGVNNIYTNLEEIQNEYTFCDDVSSSIKWISWGKHRENIRVGYSYACKVNEFLQAVPHLPHLNITSLLI